MVPLPRGLLDSGPVVVGGTGGSGTRVVARILRRAELFIGTELNESDDAWKLGEYSDRWINEFLSYSDEQVPIEVEGAMFAELAALVREHCVQLDAGRPWGWKEPRSIYLLPFFHRHLPALRFLHVVRDGRDMALSSNQNQLRKHGASAPIPTDLAEPGQSIALWGWVNLRAARYGAERLGDRYLRIRFEDLCARPVELSGDILRFCGLDGDPEVALDVIAVPPSLGRWRGESPETIAALEEHGGQALVKLGYERVAG